MFPEQQNINAYECIKVSLASPDKILSWSKGEVTKPETINYRSLKPERDGLFCARIFGPVNDWECLCGKYKRQKFKGVICDKCGVEVTKKAVRRERMGHIKLASPVSHVWFFKGVPSRIGYLLDIPLKDLERVLYFEAYAVIDSGETGLKEREIIAEERYRELKSEHKETFKAMMGAEAIKELLKQVDIEALAIELRHSMKNETSSQKRLKVSKRLKVVEAFKRSGNKPEWMILDVVPVLPPELRPLVPLDGGRFATSDLNDLYRRVINRNNRLKKLLELRAPEVIVRNEKRMLQEAADALFENGKRGRLLRGVSNRPLKSLSDALKGKQGRFRQNLLGKRVDYSGRSVIVVGPELRLHQCGLPKTMAVELFKPFIIHKLVEKGIAETVKRAKKIVERESPEVYEILEEIIQDHPVLLNRAPTLHRLGIQAFEPVLVEGKAIRIHPLVCAAFNADFDGDQMAVHVPLSFESQLEARVLMISSNNILKPSDGRPVAEPSQDMVLGCYFLTKAGQEFEARLKTAPHIASLSEVEMALSNGRMDHHAPIYFWYAPPPEAVNAKPGWIATTAGRVLFNSIVPRATLAALGFKNDVMRKRALSELVFESYRSAGLPDTVLFLDRLKEFGFRYATMGGISIGVEDLEIPREKTELLTETGTRVERFQKAYTTGQITFGERYNKVIDAWTHANNDIAEAMVAGLARSQGGFNPVFMMFDSGSRGSRDQIRQLAGMRGLMAKPQKKLTGGIGEVIESPIKSNFREGLTVLEYFISTHGARKGLADTALKTADAGYLTRRLVDVAQDVTVTEEDCGTVRGLEVSALKEGEDIIEPLRERIVGVVALDSVEDPHELDEDGLPKVLVEAGGMMNEETAQAIEDAGIETMRIRSVLTCEARRGICRMCYGRNLATMDMVDAGEAVGILAAQSIGEPGTQLTLRTFHIGGTAARIAETTARKTMLEGTIEFGDRLALVKTADGMQTVTGYDGELILKDREGQIRSRFPVPLGAKLALTDGQDVKPVTSPDGKREGYVLYVWDPYTNPIITDVTGKVRFVEIVDDETVREEFDEITGLRQRVIIEDREKKLHPHLEIVQVKGDKERKIRDYVVPEGAQLTVDDGQTVHAGDTIAKISREAYKTRDITGGLPRVAELFEARRPKDPATISEIDGAVKFGDIKRGKREIYVQPDSGEPQLYEVPAGKHLRVHEGDKVRAGDRLTEGPVNPHDILRIKGPRAVQEYLLNEVQEVYRLQGVKINDKHIGVIVRQMLQKVRVQDPGDTDFLEGEAVDKLTFRERNDRVVKKGGAPAKNEPLLLGITKASLTTQSFISAASFQETTRVLTDASIRGAKDDLLGLKENIIIGHLIPAGSGIYRYSEIEIQPPAGFEPPPPPVEGQVEGGAPSPFIKETVGAAEVDVE